jgi:hypothetical protein
VAWVRERNIPTEQPPLVGKVSANFVYRGCLVVSVTDPYGRTLGFLDRSHYFFFQVVPHLYSRGWVGPVPDPLLLRKSDRTRNRTRTSGSVSRNSDHQTTEAVIFLIQGIKILRLRSSLRGRIKWDFLSKPDIKTSRHMMMQILLFIY